MKYSAVILLLFVGQASADSSLLKSGVSWLKGQLPQSTQVSFEREKISFQGCKQRTYEVLVNHQFDNAFFVESNISYHRGRLDDGLGSQRLTSFSFSLVPRYQLSHRMSLGMGLEYDSAPRLTNADGSDFRLGRQSAFVVSSRFNGFEDNHFFELSVKNNRRDDALGFDSLANGFSERQVQFEYRGSF